MHWKKLTKPQIKARIQIALGENVNFTTDPALGYPVSNLDTKVFPSDVKFLSDAPTLQVYVANPNHIGCHTFGKSENAFNGTQQLEPEVINIIAVDIFKSEQGQFDGYIASGGTEANIQAIWIYRNHFMTKFGAALFEIAIVASEDTHYSIPKASNLLMIDWIKIPVGDHSRRIKTTELGLAIAAAKANGKKYFIAVANLGTTMFGSVDDPQVYSEVFEKQNVPYKLHVDGAYGGFVYPFSKNQSKISFQNPNISSFTIDAHKMLQAPYGTGIFVCRKGLIENTLTKEAEYVEGLDLTLCGSRSGSNAVAVWTIHHAHGPDGWQQKINVLQARTDAFCKALAAKGIEFFREPDMNIVTIRSGYVPKVVAKHFSLIPEIHGPENSWYKIVVMEHVLPGHLKMLIDRIEAETLLSEAEG